MKKYFFYGIIKQWLFDVFRRFSSYFFRATFVSLKKCHLLFRWCFVFWGHYRLRVSHIYLNFCFFRKPWYLVFLDRNVSLDSLGLPSVSSPINDLDFIKFFSSSQRVFVCAQSVRQKGAIEEWHQFVRTLKWRRPFRPLQGVFVVFNAITEGDGDDEFLFSSDVSDHLSYLFKLFEPEISVSFLVAGSGLKKEHFSLGGDHLDVAYERFNDECEERFISSSFKEGDGGRYTAFYRYLGQLKGVGPRLSKMFESITDVLGIGSVSAVFFSSREVGLSRFLEMCSEIKKSGASKYARWLNKSFFIIFLTVIPVFSYFLLLDWYSGVRFLNENIVTMDQSIEDYIVRSSQPLLSPEISHINREMSPIFDVDQLMINVFSKSVPWSYSFWRYKKYFNAWVRRSIESQWLPYFIFSLDQRIELAVSQQSSFLYPLLRLRFGLSKSKPLNKEELLGVMRFVLTPSECVHCFKISSFFKNRALPIFPIDARIYKKSILTLRKMQYKDLAFSFLRVAALGYVFESGVIKDIKKRMASAFHFKSESSFFTDLYTKDGLAHFFVSMSNKSVHSVMDDAVEMGFSSVVSPISMIKHDVDVMYAHLYLNMWKNFVSQFEIKKSMSFKDAKREVDALLEHPLVFNRFSFDVHKHVRPIFNRKLGGMSDFKVLENMGALSRSSIVLLKNLSATLGRYQGFSDAAILREAIKVISGTDHVLVALKEEAKYQAWPINVWLDELVDNVWMLLVRSIYMTMNEEWQEHVFPLYSLSLNDHFPFNRHADVNASLASIDQFFSDSSDLFKFSQRFVKPFVEMKKKSWVSKNSGGLHFPFSHEILDQFKRAYEIHNDYFSNDTHRLSFSFHIKPLYLSPLISQVRFLCGRTQLVYRHGPRISEVCHWPSPDGSRASLVANYFSQNKQLAVEAEDEWAVFRIIQSMHLQTALNQGGYVLSAFHGAVQFIITLDYPFSALMLSSFNGFNLPDQLKFKGE